MKRALRQITYREIRKNLGRFLALVGIVTLGAGFLTGLRTTKSAMLETLNIYDTENAMFDFRVVSTLGLTDADRDNFAALPGVESAEGSVSADAVFAMSDGVSRVLRAMTLTQEVNTPKLRAGRLPQAPDECVLDAWYFGEDRIGTTVALAEENDEDTAGMFAYREYKVVGLVNSPLYINFTRGTTTLGSGAVSGFVCIPEAGFNCDHYTEIYVRLAQTGYVYSQAYDDAVDAFRDTLTDAADARGDARYEEVRSDAQATLDDEQKKYDDALADYEDGVRDYEDGRTQAEQELKDAMDQIYIAERKLSQSRTQLDEGWAALTEAQSGLDAQKASFEASRADAEQKLAATRAALDQSQASYSAALAQYQAGAQAYGEAAMAAQKAQLDALKQQLDEGESAYAASAAQLQSAEQQLADGQTALDQKRAALESGEAEYRTAYGKICTARADYADAKAQSDQELADAAQKLSDARAELDDGKQKLTDGQKELDALARPTVYVLDRYTNSGYTSFESDSNIVAGIAKVFPVFFFLVAALVCVTTMNRMVDEQRTQIGVLKALGYTAGEIMRGYLLYSGIATGVGSVLGAAVGSAVFPTMIWQAYNIMYGFTEITLVFDWGLAAVVCGAFMACSLTVTWLSCRSELREVPAELVRPRSPKAGKRILLERIPFLWNRFSFLQKVSARNIFRYRKRMYMMIVGIAGCTALLITGFGIDNSISGLADTQFTEVSLYDEMVSFREPMTEADQADYLKECGSAVTDCAFLSMYSVDADVNGALKSVYLVGSDETDLSAFMNFSLNGVKQAYPGDGEVLINDYLARRMGVGVGDTITLQDSEMHRLTLKVSGIFYNVIYNYAYVTRNTLRQAEGFDSDVNVAYLDLNEQAGLYESAAAASGSDYVMSSTVNDQFRSLVRNMLFSMKYIVALVTFCAGALAFIVLYNLANININERIREIATIKVLGFNARETSAYVFRENLALTLMGMVVGIPLGIALHSYVMSQIRIDMISFRTQIYGVSYLLAVALTVAFALAVDGLMRFRLDGINMAESLKSVE